MIAAMAGAGWLLPQITEMSEENTLRYTNAIEDNAPPEVAIGTAIGAVKGILVDVLWVRATILKEKGLFHEANTLAELITKLQPRFPSVWAFQGHNMAYNISVATDTETERWEWVRKGIDLVRNEGLRQNPDDVELYRELAFWFSHKIEGIADDAHIYYKTQHAREWHNLLGQPPYEWDIDEEKSPRTKWIRRVADAPETLADAMSRSPRLSELIESLRADLTPLERVIKLELGKDFLYAYSNWNTIRTSWYARTLQRAEGMLRLSEFSEDDLAAFAERHDLDPNQVRLDWLNARAFSVFDRYAADSEYKDAIDTLLAFVRKKVLREEYNMDPQFMYELTKKWGPIDWRHGSAHCLYWSRMGEKRGETRANNEDRRFKIVNNDREAAHAMQDLSRFGIITYDPFSNDLPGRLPDPRWIQAADRFFEELYKKHVRIGTHGWGPDNFIAFHQNFLEDKVRELYRMGDKDGAQRLMDRLDSLYGTQGMQANSKYKVPLDVFVQEKTYREYDMQPHIATTDVSAAMYYAIRAGLGRGKPELYEEAKKFADEVLKYFRFNKYSDFVNKFGVERISGIIGSLERVEVDVFGRIMVDTSIPFEERMRIYNVHMPAKIRAEVYDIVRPQYELQLEYSPLQGAMTIDQILPEPPGLAEVRERRRREAELRAQQEATSPRIEGR